MEKLDQIQIEWLVITALRELLTIVKKTPDISTVDAIKFAIAIAPEIAQNSKIGAYEMQRLQDIAKNIDNEAAEGSINKDDGRTSAAYIEKKISEIRKQLEQLAKYPDAESFAISLSLLDYQLEKPGKQPEAVLKKELSDLIAVSDSRKSGFGNFQTITENQAILNDVFLQRPNAIWIQNQLGKFNTYINKDSNTIFRIAILHPNPSEAIIGADLIYEQYDNSSENVRIAAII